MSGIALDEIAALDRRADVPQEVAGNLHHLLENSGIATAPARWYLVTRMTYHLGHRPAPPRPPGELNAGARTFVEQRALQLLEEHHDLFRPLARETL